MMGFCAVGADRLKMASGASRRKPLGRRGGEAGDAIRQSPGVIA